MKKSNIFIFLLVIIFAGVILTRLFFMKRVSKPPITGKKTIEKIVVRVMPVEKGEVRLVLSYVGSLKAKDEVDVFSKVPGKLAYYTINEGDIVEKGQTIALIDRDETGLKYELAKVETPISGIVGRTLLDKGAQVVTTTSIMRGTSIAIVVNMDEMIVRLNAPEQDIPYLKVGLKAEARVDAYPDEVFIGEISKVSEVVDPSTRTLPIEISVPNKDRRLKSGMFGRIKIIASLHKDVLVLLQDAVVRELGLNYVFVVEENRAYKRKVTIGIQEDSRIEVLDGVKEGEQVIIFGQQGLRDTTPVEIAQE